MLIDVINGLKGDEKPIIHSNRGCHYRWPEWIKLIEENGLIRNLWVCQEKCVSNLK